MAGSCTTAGCEGRANRRAGDFLPSCCQAFSILGGPRTNVVLLCRHLGDASVTVLRHSCRASAALLGRSHDGAFTLPNSRGLPSARNPGADAPVGGERGTMDS